MKMKFIFLTIILGILGLAGYKIYDTVTEEYVAEVKTPIPVTTYETELIDIPLTITYQGSVAPLFVENISFKSGGRLEMFDGLEGQELKEGHILASLNLSDLNLALDAAKNQLSAAQADYARALKGARDEDIELARISVEKADQALTYLEDQVTKMTSLFEEGIVSQSELEGIQLELDLARKDAELAEENLNKALSGTEAEIIQAAAANVALAKTNVASNQAMIDDASYMLEKDMILIKKLYEEGELVPAGYPVAVLRSPEKIVTIGVSGKDLAKIQLGQEVDIRSGDKTGTGNINRIAEIPDQDHFLYEVEVLVKEGGFIIGEITECQITYDQIQGIALPIYALKNDGIDYVYIYEDGLARIQKVDILDIYDNKVLVDGIEEGTQIIISNLNRISENSSVKIKE